MLVKVGVLFFLILVIMIVLHDLKSNRVFEFDDLTYTPNKGDMFKFNDVDTGTSIEGVIENITHFVQIDKGKFYNGITIVIH